MLCTGYPSYSTNIIHRPLPLQSPVALVWSPTCSRCPGTTALVRFPQCNRGLLHSDNTLNLAQAQIVTCSSELQFTTCSSKLRIVTCSSELQATTALLISTSKTWLTYNTATAHCTYTLLKAHIINWFLPLLDSSALFRSLLLFHLRLHHLDLLLCWQMALRSDPRWLPLLLPDLPPHIFPLLLLLSSSCGSTTP